MIRTSLVYMKKLIFVLALVFALVPFTSQAAVICYDFNTNLYYGLRGSAVAQLQALLIERGYLHVAATGYFGPLTLQAVKNFQGASGISQTGFAGPITRGYIRTSTCLPSNPNAPVIDGISGPTTLDVNQSGNWSVRSHDPQNGSLTYSVVWGDEAIVAPLPYGVVAAQRIFVQTATFQHTYATAGVYHPVFYVQDEQGLTSSVSLSVSVGSVTGQSIQVVSPNGGENWTIGQTQTISWTGPSLICTTSIACRGYQQLYDIKIAPYYACLESSPPCLIAQMAPATIATGVIGDTYNWVVGKSESGLVNGGRYKIIVCLQGGNVCDQSDRPFTITQDGY